MIKSHQCKDVTCMLYLYICIESFDSFGTNATSQSLAKSNSFVINIIRYHAVGYFSKSGDDLLLSDWCDMTTCLVMSHLALSYMAQNKPFPYMLMIASNTSCNCYAQCSWEIYFSTCKMYIHIYWRIWCDENDQKPWQSETRQDNTEVSPYF